MQSLGGFPQDGAVMEGDGAGEMQRQAGVTVVKDGLGQKITKGVKYKGMEGGVLHMRE